MITEIGQAGYQVPGARTQLHGIGQVLVGTRRRIILFIDRTRGQAEPQVEIKLVHTPSLQCEQAAERYITDTTGPGGEFFAHAGHMLHFNIQIRRHDHDSEVIIHANHRTEHLHIHAHVQGRNQVLAQDIAAAEPAGTVPVTLHVHVHITIGQHPVTRGMCMRTHNTDRFIADMVVTGHIVTGVFRMCIDHDQHSQERKQHSLCYVMHRGCPFS